MPQSNADGEDRQAAGYARISLDKVGDAHGVEAQESEVRDFGEEIGHPVGRMYVDNDISAFSGAERPEYDRLIADIEADVVPLIIIWHANRLHRRVEEVLWFIKIARAHRVRIFSVTLGGEYNLNRAAGRDQLIADTLKAETESAHRGERVSLGRKAQARAGAWGGGHRPYGWGIPYDPPKYRRVLVNKETREYADVEILDMDKHNPVEAAEIRRMALDILAGVSENQIIRDLKRRNVATSTAADGRSIRRLGKVLGPGQWSRQAVRQLLTAPRTSGHSVHHGKIEKRNAWPAIIPEEQRQRLAEIFYDPARLRPGAGSVPTWLGSKIYVCGWCDEDAKMRIAHNGSGVPQYRCDEHGHNRVPAKELDEYITDVIVAILGRPDAADLIQVPGEADIAELKAQRHEQEERSRVAARLFATGSIGAEQLGEITKIINEALGRINKALTALAKVDPLADLVAADIAADAWRAASLGRKREALKTLMKVTLLPGVGKRDGRRIVDVDPAFVKIEPIRTPQVRLAVAGAAEAQAQEGRQVEFPAPRI